jgi:hypothetical protein
MFMRHLAAVVAVGVLLLAPAGAQQKEAYDYWRMQRDMIQRGQQALIMCNGLFTSNRTLEQVFAQELAILRTPIGTAAGGDYEIDRARKAVAVGAPGAAPVMRSAYREGIGCVSMAPDQTFDDIDSLPVLTQAPPPGDPARTPWPDGDADAGAPLPPGGNAARSRQPRTGPSTGSRASRSRSASSSSIAERSFTSATRRAWT